MPRKGKDLALKELRFQSGGGRDRLKAAAKIPWGVSLQDILLKVGVTDLSFLIAEFFIGFFFRKKTVMS